MKNWYEKYMLIMGCAGQLLYFLQAYKIFHDRSATDVSLSAFIFGLVSVSSWLIYGIMIKDRVLLVANVFAVIGALAVVTGILIYS